MRTWADRFRTLYGAPPAHLLVLLASFAVCGYAGVRLLARDGADVAKWVVGAALVHDLVLLPLYACADWALHKALRLPVRPGRSEPGRTDTGGSVPGGNEPGGSDHGRTGRSAALRLAVLHHVRVPALLSLLLLLVYWPLISGARTHYRAGTDLDPGVFPGRWLLLTAALFAASAAVLALRWWRTLRRAR
nr:hypothetical protein [Streptomyces sp. SN-593]